MQSKIRRHLLQHHRTALSVVAVCLMSFSLITVGFAARRRKKGSHHGFKPVGRAYVYKRVNGTQLHLYVLQRKQSTLRLKPAIIFFHGGGWFALHAGQFTRQAKYLAAHGMVTIEVQYRLIPRAGDTPPKICVEDAKSAVRWVREHHNDLGVNPNMIAESGGSAGGYLAAFATMVPGWNDPHDNLSVSPKADVLALYNPVIDNGPSGYGYRRFRKSYKRYSPYFYTSSSTPPTLIMSGMKDTLIPPEVLKTFRSKLEALGVPCKLVLYTGQEHGFFNHQPYERETTKVLASFLETYGYLHDSRVKDKAQRRNE